MIARLGTSESRLGNLELGVIGAHTTNIGSSSLLTLIQSARGFNGSKFLSQALTFIQTVSRTGTFVKTASSALTFHQAASAIRLQIAHNTLTFSQSAVADLTKGARSTLTLTQTLTSTYTPHNERPIQQLLLAQTAVGHRIIHKSVSHTLALSQSTLRVPIHTRNVHQTFVIASNVAGNNQSLLTNHLNLTQVALGHRIMHWSASNHLNLHQALARNVSYVRGPSNVLVFKTEFYKDTIIAGQLQTIVLPNALVTKIVRNSITFRTNARAITLRRPMLGDAEGSMDKIILHRTSTGSTFTYAKTTQCRKLKYNFELDRNKALELRRYVLDCMSTPMWLSNWKGELWLGYIMNNPFDFNPISRGLNGGDQYKISLEFEGQRIQ